MAAIKANNRWTRMNNNFRKQIRLFMLETGMNVQGIARECEISASCLYNYMNDCSYMTKLTERHLIRLFEEHEMHYDPTQGEGIA